MRPTRKLASLRHPIAGAAVVTGVAVTAKPPAIGPRRSVEPSQEGPGMTVAVLIGGIRPSNDEAVQFAAGVAAARNGSLLLVSAPLVSPWLDGLMGMAGMCAQRFRQEMQVCFGDEIRRCLRIVPADVGVRYVDWPDWNGRELLELLQRSDCVAIVAPWSSLLPRSRRQARTAAKRLQSELIMLTHPASAGSSLPRELVRA
jgi:hypothetical protein